MAWTEQPNGKQRNDAVAADLSATHRGGALDLDPISLQQTLTPWNDGTGDHLTIDFVLPGALENHTTPSWGWEADVAGTNWKAGVGDLGTIKGVGQSLDPLLEFASPGSQAYVRMPITEVPVSGEWRPVQKQLGGNWQDHYFTYQDKAAMLAALPTSTIPDYVDGSLTIEHKTKSGDYISTGKHYMTGVVGHLPAPLAACLRANGQVLGYVFGYWEFDDVLGRITKVYDAAAIRAISAQTAIVVLDGTYGYTAMGTSSISWSEFGNSTPAGNTAEAGVMDSLTVGINRNTDDASGYQISGGLYVGPITATSALITNSDIYSADTVDSLSLVAAGSYGWLTVPYATNDANMLGAGDATKPSVSTGTQYGMRFAGEGDSAAIKIMYNTSQATQKMIRAARTAGAAPTDPFGAIVSEHGTIGPSLYMTISESVGGFTERGTARGVARGVARGT